MVGQPIQTLVPEVRDLLTQASQNGCAEAVVGVARSGGGLAALRLQVVQVADGGDGLVLLAPVEERVDDEVLLCEAEEWSPVMRLHTDLDGRLLRTTARLHEWLGYEEAALRQQALPDLIHPNDRAATAALLEKVRGGALPQFGLDQRWLTKGGDVVWAHLEATVVFDRTGRPRHLLAYLQDITEQKTTQEALRASEERRRLAQQVARIGSFELDIQRNVTVWSAELEALYGLPPGGYDGSYEAWATRVHPHDLAQVERALSASLESGSFETEWRVVWPDGAVHWLAARGQIFKDEQGRPVRMVGVNLDIDEQKRAEQALRESELRLRRFYESGLLGVIYWNMHGQIMDANDKFLEMVGYTREELRAGRFAGKR